MPAYQDRTLPTVRLRQPATSKARHRMAAIWCGLILGSCLSMGTIEAALAQTVRIAGTGSATGTMRALAQGFQKSSAQARVAVPLAIGSSGAIKAVLAGEIEIAVTSRPLSKDERDRGAVETEYGRTPFVFATWPGNSTNNVTSATLADLYSAKTAAWPDRTQVRLVLRPRSDIDTELVKGISPQLREAVTLAERRPGMTVADTDSDAVDAIERLPGSLGTATLAQLLSEHPRVKMLRLDGVEPSAKALAEGRYPLFKRVYFVTGPQPGPGVKEFLAFVRSKAGRAILERTGHVITPLR